MFIYDDIQKFYIQKYLSFIASSHYEKVELLF